MPNQTPFGKCFVTGGAGFVGSHLVDGLVSEGNQLTVYDNLVCGKKEWLAHHIDRSDFRFLEGDILNMGDMTKAMTGHDMVWHLAANTDIAAGMKDVKVDLESNTIGTINVLEAMRDHGIKTIVFTSTSAVYGEPDISPTPENFGPLLPISYYGASKLACEGYISSYCEAIGIKAYIFRFANVVGGRMTHGVIRDFVLKLKKNPRELEIWGDGNQYKSYFLAEDCIDAMLHVAKTANSHCDIYNLSARSRSRVRRIGEIVIEEMGLNNVTIRYTGGRRGFVGDVPELLINVDKASDLGWEAHHSSDEAVRVSARRLLDKE